MRHLLVVMLVGLPGGLASAQEATRVEVKGPHVCCNQCVRVVGTILGKVEGVSDVKSDIPTKTVTFAARDDKAAKEGFQALVKGGFFGTATQGGKEIKLELPASPRGEKADTVTVKDVHVCCNRCQVAIRAVFKDGKVSFEGTGAQKSVKIEGKDLDRGAVLEALKQAGFHGTVEK
jgi:copper chaperone CopZ